MTFYVMTIISVYYYRLSILLWIQTDFDILTKYHVRIGNNTVDPILDSIISDKELCDALAAIKIGKAAGPDEVSGEYLKIFGKICEPIMLKLVRVIFSDSSYPEKWTLNFLRPIYKNGLAKDTNNFRGLAIGLVFGKLYSTILLNRLMRHSMERKLISPEQIGFMKNTGTSDHNFPLANNYCKSRK